MNYYVRVGEDNAGPFSLEELARRGVAVDEYVWREGLADWTLAGELPEVASARKSQPTFAPPPSSDSPYRSPTQDYVDYRPLHGDEPLRHSGLGIASLAVAGVSLLVFVIAFGAVIAVQAQDPDIDPNDSPVIMVSSVSLCCGIPLLNAVGLLLGIIAVFQPDRLKLFGVIGSIINGIVVFGGVAFVIFAMILGASMQ